MRRTRGKNLKKNLIRKGTVAALAVSLLAVSLPAQAAETMLWPVRTEVAGEEISPSAFPIMENGDIYIDFASAARALGFDVSYDKAKKQIKAVSEAAKITVDVKNRKIYVDGKLFKYAYAPTVTNDGGNVMVLLETFNQSEAFSADFDVESGTIYIMENEVQLSASVQKKILNAAKAEIGQYYAGKISDLKLETSGDTATVTAKVFVPRGISTEDGDRNLFDTIIHAEVQLYRTFDRSWEVDSSKDRYETEYPNYKSVAEKEDPKIGAADKAAIRELVGAYVKALDEEDAEGVVALMRLDELQKMSLFPTFKDIVYTVGSTFIHENYDYRLNKAVVFDHAGSSGAWVYASIARTAPADDLLAPGTSVLDKVFVAIKGSDGKWLLEPMSGGAFLHSDRDLLNGYSEEPDPVIELGGAETDSQ
ncbi:hypothetical protein CDO73_12950 [Saccharibacillus sp. O23]|uniref:stalk domain-containing protein n=1 Tax=Saccharibacillus sp. O23 TaxID=2009338 RepID=UPI000B4E0BEF|nr:stalk domain-containing protein [Saccharibacillus sp. O23]OWR29980.1 hypothetical protein CDO73_12950 [Saccharibacillus sp. O23]